MSGDNKLYIVVPVVLAFGMVTLSLSLWFRRGGSPYLASLSWRQSLLWGCCPFCTSNRCGSWCWRRRRKGGDKLCPSCSNSLSGDGTVIGCGLDTTSLSSTKNFVPKKDKKVNFCECPCHFRQSCRTGEISVIRITDGGFEEKVNNEFICFDGGSTRFLNSMGGVENQLTRYVDGGRHSSLMLAEDVVQIMRWVSKLLCPTF